MFSFNVCRSLCQCAAGRSISNVTEMPNATNSKYGKHVSRDSPDLPVPTILDLHFNTASTHSLRFRFHCFIACLIRCTALLNISVYWRTTSALLLLL